MGYFCQSRYQVQILDSFGLEATKGDCGAIYGLAGPRVATCFPALSWQTFDVDFTAAEFRDGKKVKAVFPGGLSMGVLRGDMFPKNPAAEVDPAADFDELDCKLDFDDPQRYGLMGLGTGAAVVVPEDADIRDVMVNVARFFALESCGQCTQCREGTMWMYKMAQRIRAGAGRTFDLDVLDEVSRNMGMMPGLSICGLSDGAAWPIGMLVRKFRAEFERHIAAQEPDAAARHIRAINPAAYELPILGVPPMATAASSAAEQ